MSCFNVKCTRGGPIEPSCHQITIEITWEAEYEGALIQCDVGLGYPLQLVTSTFNYNSNKANSLHRVNLTCHNIMQMERMMMEWKCNLGQINTTWVPQDALLMTWPLLISHTSTKHSFIFTTQVKLKIIFLDPQKYLYMIYEGLFIKITGDSSTPLCDFWNSLKTFQLLYKMTRYITL